LDKPVDDSAAQNPRRVFGAMLAYYRTRAGMTPEQLGAKVYLSGSQIRKVEAGSRSATEDLARACEPTFPASRQWPTRTPRRVARSSKTATTSMSWPRDGIL
jgi:hypothetical protein